MNKGLIGDLYYCGHYDGTNYDGVDCGFGGAEVCRGRGGKVGGEASRVAVGYDRLSLYWTKEDGGESSDNRSGEGAGCGGDRQGCDGLRWGVCGG